MLQPPQRGPLHSPVQEGGGPSRALGEEGLQGAYGATTDGDRAGDRGDGDGVCADSGVVQAEIREEGL